MHPMGRAAKIGLFSAAVYLGGVLIFTLFRTPPKRLAPKVPAPTSSEIDLATERLREFERSRHAGATFEHLPSWERQSGPDPYVVRRVPSTDKWVGILRGASSLVVHDGALGEVQRLPAPEGPSGLTVADDGTVYVAGELSKSLARYRWRGRGFLEPAGTWSIDGARALRDVAVGPSGWVYLVDEHDGDLIALRLDDPGATMSRHKVGQGPIRIERVGDRLIVDCLLDHSLVILRSRRRRISEKRRAEENRSRRTDLVVRRAEDGGCADPRRRRGRGPSARSDGRGVRLRGLVSLPVPNLRRSRRDARGVDQSL